MGSGRMPPSATSGSGATGGARPGTGAIDTGWRKRAAVGVFGSGGGASTAAAAAPPAWACWCERRP